MATSSTSESGSALAMHEAEGRHLVLVGLPGAGKTTTGIRLSHLWRRPFIDFDQEIERRQGKSVAQLFVDEGEARFRELEGELSREVASSRPAILAPGGGWITRPEAVANLRGRSRIIWLWVSVGVAVSRMGRNVRLRPLLAGGDPVGELSRLAQEREPLYAVADAVVNTEVLSSHELTNEITRLAGFWGMGVG